MANILLVDDDPDVLRSVRRILEDAGHTLRTASDGEEALRAIQREQPELVVLDIIMPEMDGVEVCRRIRADPYVARTPILFLTAKGRAKDVAQGLDAGGDDYLVKPFEVIELPARVRALLRRAPGGPLDAETDYLEAGPLRLHNREPEVLVDGQAVALTAVEHRVLHYLMLHAGQPIATEQLLQDVWEYPPGTGDPKLVHVHIGNLRSKIEPQGSEAQIIRNVRGRGYLVAT